MLRVLYIIRFTIDSTLNLSIDMRLLFSLILILRLNFIYAQTKKTPKKELLISKVEQSAVKKTALRPNIIEFSNIEDLRYHNLSQLKTIASYEEAQDWDNLFVELYKYVQAFTIENFMSSEDMLLVWKLAHLSDLRNLKSLSRDLYRLIVKHHRDSLHIALYKYRDIINYGEPLYTDRDYYYRLIGKIKAIDTIPIPEEIMRDMGEDINSKFPDYGLTIGSDDRTMYFSSQRHPKQSLDYLLDLNQDAHENIYASTFREEDGYWSKAEPLDALNTNYKEGSPCVSDDGKLLLFARCHSPDGFGNCDLYTSTLKHDSTGKYWAPAVNMGNIINSYAWDSHPNLVRLEDTLFLYFASDRRGGFGGTDLYFSYQDAKGIWTKPKNLGPYINTQFNEVSPFIHKTYKNVLYFSSDAQLINFGDFDIFKTFKVNGQWIEPKNVGPLINGKGSEFYFTIDSHSNKLFYARSEHDKIENLDLHASPLPMEAKPNNIIRFSGKVVEPITGEVFKGKVSIIDLDARTPVAPHNLYDDGSFEFELINHKNYLLVVEGDNFFRVERNFFLDGDTDLEVEVTSIKRSITFESIDFKTNQSDILPQMENNLHAVIDFLKEHEDYNLEVIGHTDSDGDHDLNLKLSKERAKNIRTYILKYGNLEEWRIIADGVGDQEPIVKIEKTEDDKKLNRRVEFNMIHQRLWKY